ncbi:polysaccharide lyase family 7 protein [Ochrovirga pacifica]|uniref:polysaccharide lyase family 7 protein n=1 Tax=Ochrovirga pacifica TaxID=1042376 RepID=UPI0002557791
MTVCNKLVVVFLFTFISVNVTCQEKASSITETHTKKKKSKKYKLPKIDLNHWSVTTPELNSKGKATTIEPPEILNYATNNRLIPYMYNDSIKGTLVFYAYPSNATTANTKYSRSELREQMEPGNNNVNWTFKQGGKMKGTLKVDEVSKNDKGKYHKVIIMQIHGRLTNEQRDLIGQKDNNAPPILKIYWQDGKIRVKTKVLKKLDATYQEMLHEDAWGDDEGYTFDDKVGHRKFTLEVKVSEGKMVIVLNGHNYKVYEGVHMEKWGIFENYFKAGNYFQSRDEGAYAKVHYYKLKVSH